MRVHLATGEVEPIWTSRYGAYPAAWSPDHARAFLGDFYTAGDVVLYEPDGDGGRRILYGTPIEEREEGVDVPTLRASTRPTARRAAAGSCSSRASSRTPALPATSTSSGPARSSRSRSRAPAHEGVGRALGARCTSTSDRYVVHYNVDGCAWAYEARLDEAGRRLEIERVLVGEGELSGGVLHGLHYDEGSGRFALSFCTATTPTQLYVLDAGAAPPSRKTRERPLGISPDLLSAGEDASFESHDGLRVSARLYLPSEELGYAGPRPLVYYVHGGPQSQERPNFAWFSMPLIQILTLEGFAVFVPNARGSTGYGLELHEARRPGLGRPGPARPRPRDDRGAAAGRARGRRPRRRGRSLVRRLHDAHAREPPSGALARGGRHVRAVRPHDVLGADPRDLEAVLRARARRPGARPRLHRRALSEDHDRRTSPRRCSSSRVRTTRGSSSASRTTSSRVFARSARTSTTSSSRTRATTC